VPTGAAAGAVLTSDDAGHATWQSAAGGGIVLGVPSLIGPYGSGGDTAWSIDCPEGTVATSLFARLAGTQTKSFRFTCTALTTSLGVNPVTGAGVTYSINFGATQGSGFSNPGFGTSSSNSDCPEGMLMTGALVRNSGSNTFGMQARCTEAGPGTNTGNGPLLGFTFGTATTFDCPAGTAITGAEGVYDSSIDFITTTNFRCR
jgi:hypothetical protein